MACLNPSGVTEQEMMYLDTLQAVTTWQIGMNGLTLTADDGRALLELNVVTQYPPVVLSRSEGPPRLGRSQIEAERSFAAAQDDRG